MKTQSIVFLFALQVLSISALVSPARIVGLKRSSGIVLRAKKRNNMSKQLDLQKKFEEAKQQKQREASLETANTIDYNPTSGPKDAAESGDMVTANRSWRSNSIGGGAGYEEMDRAMDSPADYMSFSTPTMASSAAAAPLSEASDGRIEYLKPGSPAPLEVWSTLEDTKGGGVSFESISTDRPLVAVVTHYRENSAVLKAALESLAQRIPRKAFPAELIVVTRDTPAANGRLAKSTKVPATFLSCANGGAWCLSHGITSQLVEFGVSVFVIEASSGILFAASYDCDPSQAADFLKKAAAVYTSRKGPI